MRRVVAFLALVVLALTTTACDMGLDNRYAREGIGNDLYWSGLPDATQLQEAYLGYICRQAGFPVIAEGTAVRCIETSMGPREWGIFVQAGMNDIDLRCDAYLAWLDDKKRAAGPILSQIHDTRTAIEAIMAVTSVSPIPIAIVGSAFGLASNTFTNVSTRLILQMDKTTVQALVLGRRNEYRVKLAAVTAGNRPAVILDNRPAAIHALRSYLNICTPFTIETDINSTITVFQQGGPGALDNKPLVHPGTVVTPGRGTMPTIRADRPPPPTPPPAQLLGGAIGSIEQSISLRDGTALQKMLCVNPTGDFGSSGSLTRNALRDFFSAFTLQTDIATIGDTVATNQNLGRLRNAQRAFPSCKDIGFFTAFEVGAFARAMDPVSGTIDPMKGVVADVISALDAAQLAVPAGLRTPTFGQKVIAGMREAIPTLRSSFNMPGQPVLDRALYVRILRSQAR